MDPRKSRRLRDRGWQVGDAAEFLDLTPEETCFLDLKLALAAACKRERMRRGLTQVELAQRLGSSQSRVAKLEAGDPSVSVDLLLRGLLALGMSRRQLARIVA